MLSFLPNRSRPLEEDDYGDEEDDGDDGNDDDLYEESEQLYDGGVAVCPICSFACHSSELPQHMILSHPPGDFHMGGGGESPAPSKYSRVHHRPSYRGGMSYGMPPGGHYGQQRRTKEKIHAPSFVPLSTSSNPSSSNSQSLTTDATSSFSSNPEFRSLLSFVFPSLFSL